jgi:hypothetical protein
MLEIDFPRTRPIAEATDILQAIWRQVVQLPLIPLDVSSRMAYITRTSNHIERRRRHETTCLASKSFTVIGDVGIDDAITLGEPRPPGSILAYFGSDNRIPP